MTGFNPVLYEYYLCCAYFSALSFFIDIFSLSGKLISPHLLRCGPLEVDDHVFMGRRLASAATSTRKQHKLHLKMSISMTKNIGIRKRQ